MRNSILIAFYILSFSFFAKGNAHCNWTTRNAGITLHYTSSCDKENQSSLDSVLNKVLIQLKGRDTTLKILVFINKGQLSFNDGRSLNFISIAYDTLRAIDDDYILQYYTNQEAISTKQNHGYSTFDTRKFPLDINATNNKSTNEIGVKIIYDKDEPVWSEIVNAIVYAAKNADSVKLLQRRDTVFCKMNGWHVSLVTLAPDDINKILGRSETVAAAQTNNKQGSSLNYFIFIALALVIIAVFVIARKTKR